MKIAKITLEKGKNIQRIFIANNAKYYWFAGYFKKDRVYTEKEIFKFLEIYNSKTGKEYELDMVFHAVLDNPLRCFRDYESDESIGYISLKKVEGGYIRTIDLNRKSLEYYVITKNEY